MVLKVIIKTTMILTGQQPREGGNTSGPKNITACKVLVNAIKPRYDQLDLPMQAYCVRRTITSRGLFTRHQLTNLFRRPTSKRFINHSTNETYNQDIPLLLLIIRTNTNKQRILIIEQGAPVKGPCFLLAWAEAQLVWYQHIHHHRPMLYTQWGCYDYHKTEGHMPRLPRTFDQRKLSTWYK